MYVFGYGSLTMPESLSVELGRRVLRDELTSATLTGWRRRWNVGSDGSSHPERIIRNPDGSVFDGVVAVLGLVKAGLVKAAEGCHGAVFGVSAEDLALLDVRERNYRRIEVTSAVSFRKKPEGCVVFAYVPSRSAVARLDQAVRGPTLRPVAVRKGYLEQTRGGFATLGRAELARFDAEPAPAFPIIDLSYEYHGVEPR